MKATLILIFLLWSAAWPAPARAQTAPLSVRAADSVLARRKDALTNEPGRPEKWAYEQGVLLKGVEAVWRNTGDERYLEYIRRGVDHFVGADGRISTYKPEDYSLDNVMPGRLLLTLYKVTGQEKYRKAAGLLREQLKGQPRTSEGGFWHKKIYPEQMWLDGLYMAEPFYAEYAATFREGADFDHIARQFVLMERHARDSRRGLSCSPSSGAWPPPSRSTRSRSRASGIRCSTAAAPKGTTLRRPPLACSSTRWPKESDRATCRPLTSRSRGKVTRESSAVSSRRTRAGWSPSKASSASRAWAAARTATGAISTT